MPYTRAYQVPILPIVGEDINRAFYDDAQQIMRPPFLLNITTSSNWIQETFTRRSLVEDEELGPVFIIEKAKQSSLYQRIIDMKTRSMVCKIIVIAFDPIPTRETIVRLAESLEEGESARLDILIQEWKANIIEAYREISITSLFAGEIENTIYLNGASILLGEELESVRLTISSPDMPTRGDRQVTAIYYSPFSGTNTLNDGSTAVEGPIPFTWTDRSGFLSTIFILPNTIYEIQPVSIELGYGITLLS